MIEQAIASFKDKKKTIQFKALQQNCAHKVDEITLSQFGFSQSQIQTLMKVLVVSSTKEFALPKLRELDSNSILEISENRFSVAISLWELLERLANAHSNDCAGNTSEYFEPALSPHELMDNSVKTLNLEKFTAYVLKSAGIEFIEDLNQYSKRELCEITKLDLESINEIEYEIKKRGFSLKLEDQTNLGHLSKPDTPVDKLELSTRTSNGLNRAGITNLSKLMTATKDELRDIRNFGDKSIAEVLQKQHKVKLLMAENSIGENKVSGNIDEDLMWARNQIAIEITNLLARLNGNKGLIINEQSIENLDFSTRYRASRYMAKGPTTLEKLVTALSKSLSETSEGEGTISAIRLLAGLQNNLDRYNYLVRKYQINNDDKRLILEYANRFNEFSGGSLDLDEATLSFLGIQDDAGFSFGEINTLFELSDFLDTHLIINDLFWEILKGAIRFFKEFKAFPNITGIIVALAEDVGTEDRALQLLMDYLSITKQDFAERDALIIKMRIQGMTLDAIGQNLEITRERVRQIVKNTLPNSQAIIEHLWIDKKNNNNRNTVDFLTGLFEEFGALYVSELAENLKVDHETALKIVPKEFHKLIIDKTPLPTYRSQWTKDQVVEIIQKAATYYFPLKTSDYEYLLKIGELQGPSVPFIYNKIGLWNELCIEAGVEPAPSMKKEYVSLWNEDEVVSFLQRFIQEEESTSIDNYRDWRGKQVDHVPSGELIRNEFGSWSIARRVALEGFRTKRGKAIKP